MTGRLCGNLDSVRYRTVFGWAHDLREPDRPPVIRIQVNGADRGLVVADQPRPDLIAAGITALPRGFEWTIPDSCTPIHSVRAVSLNGGTELLPSSDSLICEVTNRPLPPAWTSARHHRFPSFFILGAAKCATTSLHDYLGQCPEVCMSNPKEPFYFEAEFERGPTYYFNRYFSHWAGEPFVGEARHRNLYMPYTAERIFRFNPRARLIVCLRNPVERAISHWWHWFSRNQEPLSFREAIRDDWERIKAGVSYEHRSNQDAYARTLQADGKGILRTYLDSGYYHDQIKRYLKLFPKKQLCTILFDDLIRDPIEVMSNLLEFIGADPANALRGNYKPLNRSKPGMLEHVDRDTLSWLVQHYRPHNKFLSQLIGRRLEHWDITPHSGYGGTVQTSLRAPAAAGPPP